MNTCGFRNKARLAVIILPVIILLFLLGLTGSEPFRRRDDHSRQQAIAKLRALGTVTVDERLAERPVLAVNLSGPRVTDTTMELVGDLTELGNLSLFDTRVTDAGIRRIGHLTLLKSLVLDGVQITDEGLSTLTSLENLESLTLNDTRVTERGLECLKGLPNLHELGLHDETFGNKSLVALEGMGQLSVLHLLGAQVTGAGIARFQRALPRVRIPRICGTSQPDARAELERRRVRRQGFTGRLRVAWRSIVGEKRPDDFSGPKAFTELLALGRFKCDQNQPDQPVVELDLSGLRVTDTTMKLIGGFAELRSLSLHDTRVTDAGIEELRSLPQLKTLCLEGVQITDEGLSALASLANLESLTLDDTQVRGRGLEGLRGLAKLRSLGLNDGEIGDEALVSLEGMTGLRELRIPEARVTEAGMARFRRALPEVKIPIVGWCGTCRSDARHALDRRRVRRQGFTGRLRLGWQSILGRS
jgi:internalin A